VNNTCVCAPGRGGSHCQFGMSSIYHEHEVYQGFHPGRADLTGWSPGPAVYDKFCRMARAQFIVEVGVWKGLSASHLGGYLKAQGSGALLCVDTWLGALEFWDRLTPRHGKAHNLQFRHGYPAVYYTFLGNMVRKGLKDYVIPFPVPSRLAATFLASRGVLADLIHIDAAHEYEDVGEDIGLWWPLVAPGGVLLGDDYTKWWPGVVRAANEFASRNHLALIADQGKWAVRKPL